MADEIIKLFEYFKNDLMIQIVDTGYAIYAIIVVALGILIFAVVFWQIIQYTRNFRSFTKRKKENPFMDYTGLKNPPVWIQFLLTGLLAIICSFTIMVMWGWFIVPLGLPAISIIHACGIDMLITFIITTHYCIAGCSISLYRRNSHERSKTN